MIIETLIVISIILIVANIFAHFTFSNTKYNKQKNEWGFEKEALEISRGPLKEDPDKKYDTDTEITLPVSKPHVNKQTFLDYGKVIANEQKLKILNNRLDNLERALTALASKNVNGEDVDLEKIDFKIKVLETEIENLKNPHKKKPHTFYGKIDDPMEKEIRSLVFNTKKK